MGGFSINLLNGEDWVELSYLTLPQRYTVVSFMVKSKGVDEWHKGTIWQCEKCISCEIEKDAFIAGLDKVLEFINANPDWLPERDIRDAERTNHWDQNYISPIIRLLFKPYIKANPDERKKMVKDGMVKWCKSMREVLLKQPESTVYLVDEFLCHEGECERIYRETSSGTSNTVKDERITSHNFKQKEVK